MARVPYTIISGSGYELALGVDMHTYSETNTAILYAPRVDRYDEEQTWNSGGYYTEVLTLGSTEIGRWTLDFDDQDRERQDWYRIDTFNERSVTKTHSTQTLKLKIYWYDFATKDSYGNWKYADDGSHEWSVQIHAKPSYTVSYNANGGSGAPSSQTKWYGETLTLSATKPTRTGYTFSGWKATNGTSYSPGASYTANSGTTMTAQWTANTYTVTYNANGHGSNPASQSRTYGGSAITLRTMSDQGNYAFKNWNTKAGGSGTTYNGGQSYSGNASLTLYAQWYAPYTISYNANGGSGAPSSQTKKHGAAINLQSGTPTRTNYVFKGYWTATSADSGTHYTPGQSYSANSSITLYAQWYAPYTITPNANGGTLASGCSALTKVHDTAKAIWDSNLNPTRSEYNFTGWNTAADGTGTSYSAGGNYTANANATLYAQWAVAHASPTVSSFLVQRCLVDGTLADDGEYVKITASWFVDNTTEGYGDTEASSAVITLDGKTDTLTLSGTSGTIDGHVHEHQGSPTQITLTASYPVTMVISDSKGYSRTVTSTVSYAFFTMSFKAHGHGIAFGKKSTRDGFDVEMDMYAKNLDISNVFSAVDGSFSGDIDAVNGSFTGDIDAVNATFSGDVDAVNATLSGDIDAVNATLSGDISAAGGTLTGPLAGTTATFEEVDFDEGSVIYEGAKGQIYIKSGVNSSNKRAHLSMSPADSTLYVRYSSDGGETWGSWQALANCAITNVFAVGPQVRHSGIDVTKANNGITANTWPAVATGFDENDVQTSFFGEAIYTDGGVSAGIWAYNYNTSGTQVGSNSLSIGVRKNGTKYYGIGDPAAFRSALGIGTFKQSDVSSNVSVATSTYKSLTSLSLEAGVWVVSYGATFAANTTGHRDVFLSTSSNAADSGAWSRQSLIQMPATLNGRAAVHAAAVISLSATTTVYFTAWQNSGSALNTTGNLSAVKVG